MPGPDPTARAPASHQTSAGLFLRFLGVIYLIAFVSLWTQILGLVGEQGILPATEFLHAARLQVGLERYWLFPTLCWLGASNAWLHLWCAAGTLLAVLLCLDLAPVPALVGLWALYLSLATVCRQFLWYQWDGLLLETGFLAIFLAPLHLGSRRHAAAPPSRLAVWLLWWLLFRLTFSSGLVKLISGDPTWRHLTALTVHYLTQPLPTPLAWHFHQLPGWFQRLSCVVMFAVELGAPWLIFAPRRWRLAGGAAMVGLQLLIAATGNYGFFNWITIALCLLLVDDARWPAPWRQRITARGTAPARHWPAWVVGTVAVLVVTVSGTQLVDRVGGRVVWPAPVLMLARWAEPFRTVNGYGLFAVMTTRRPEIIIEGSNDGVDWHAYEFKCKPGNLQRAPPIIAPFQPRLDWQLWFAALSRFDDEPWLQNFCVRLLQGSPDVLRLLARNPFPDAPPTYLRAVGYDYAFTDAATRRASGAWWRRELKGSYSPVLSLRSRS